MMDDFAVPNTSCDHNDSVNEVVSDWRVVAEGKIASEHLWCDCDVSEDGTRADRVLGVSRGEGLLGTNYVIIIHCSCLVIHLHGQLTFSRNPLVCWTQRRSRTSSMGSTIVFSMNS